MLETAPLFETVAAGARDPIDPRAVACPACGALPGRPCRIRVGTLGERVGVNRRGQIAHEPRHAQARYVAGVADEPHPTLFQEGA